MSDQLNEIAMITQMSRPAILTLLRDNGINVADLKAFYIANSRVPTVAECQTIKAKQNGAQR